MNNISGFKTTEKTVGYRVGEYQSESLDRDKNNFEDDEQSDYDSLEFPEGFDPMRKRKSVSAEVYGAWNNGRNFQPKAYPKSPEVEKWIGKTLRNCFMFQNLSENDLATIIEAFYEVDFEKGTEFIRQEEDGECLYLIETGRVDVYKEKNGKSKKVNTMGPGEIVGELALLYRCPRAATVKAIEDVKLRALDRETFNFIVRNAAINKRKMYDKFLKEVDLLKDMDPYERNKLSDAFKECVFSENDPIIQEGEIGDAFYIIEKGEAVATKNGEEVMNYKSGDYFGELALITNQRRAATVKPKNCVVTCLSFDRESFKRLLGHVEDILKRNTKRYKEFDSRLKASAS